jgi:hypothetical protein
LQHEIARLYPKAAKLAPEIRKARPDLFEEVDAQERSHKARRTHQRLNKHAEEWRSFADSFASSWHALGAHMNGEERAAARRLLRLIQRSNRPLERLSEHDDQARSKNLIQAIQRIGTFDIPQTAEQRRQLMSDLLSIASLRAEKDSAQVKAWANTSLRLLPSTAQLVLEDACAAQDEEQAWLDIALKALYALQLGPGTDPVISRRLAEGTRTLCDALATRWNDAERVLLDSATRWGAPNPSTPPAPALGGFASAGAGAACSGALALATRVAGAHPWG